MDKIYLDFKENKGYPAGRNIYYECTLCNTSINSIPKCFDSCRCENIEFFVISKDYSVNLKAPFISSKKIFI